MKAIFLDRDGVINQDPGKAMYVTSVGRFRLIPRVSAAIKKFNRLGYAVFVVSNQAGISKKVFSQATLDEITAYMLKKLKAAGAKINGVYYCVHRDTDNCSCRKPKTGLIKKIISDCRKMGRKIEIGKSYFIGDMQRDVLTGNKSKLKTVIVFTGKTKLKDLENFKHLPDFAVNNLKEAAEIIRRNG